MSIKESIKIEFELDNSSRRSWVEIQDLIDRMKLLCESKGYNVMDISKQKNSRFTSGEDLITVEDIEMD
jgi:hypothetical protein